MTSIFSVEKMVWNILPNDAKRDIVKNVLKEAIDVRKVGELIKQDIKCSICKQDLYEFTKLGKPSFYVVAKFEKGKYSFDACFWCHNHIFPHSREEILLNTFTPPQKVLKNE